METTLTAFLFYSAHVYMYINLIFTVFSSKEKLKKLLIMKNEVKKRLSIPRNVYFQPSIWTVNNSM